MNRGEQDYLKILFNLQEQLKEKEYIHVRAITSAMKHSAPAVNEMIKKMEKNGLLEYQPYSGVRLTQKGIDASIVLIRKHRLWEYFLHEHLGYTWDEVHQEAEILEHHTSDKLLEAMYRYLSQPEHCPHGNPIPNGDNTMASLSTVTLVDAKVGQLYSIVKVMDQPQILQVLDQMGLLPKEVIRVLDIDSVNQIIHLEKDGHPITLGFAVAKTISIQDK